MEEDTCFNCGNFLERREKGYKRKLISSLKIPIIKLNDILEKKISIPLSKSNKFICNNCASLTVGFTNITENHMGRLHRQLQNGKENFLLHQ